MEASKFISSDKATIVIQINPQLTQNAVISDDGPKSRGSDGNTTLTEFFKAQPKALGTVQIMIGVTIFLIGIVLTKILRYPDIALDIGVTYWGSLIYISAGSLSVTAQNKLHLCVVKASLGMNVLSAITAVVAITLMSINFTFCLLGNRCQDFEDYYLGVTGVLLVLSILQLITSIFISAFACKATYISDSTEINVTLNQVTQSLHKPIDKSKARVERR